MAPVKNLPVHQPFELGVMGRKYGGLRQQRLKLLVGQDRNLLVPSEDAKHALAGTVKLGKPDASFTRLRKNGAAENLGGGISGVNVGPTLP